MSIKMSDRMKVSVRVRPLSDKEKSENLKIHWKTDGNSIFQIDPFTGRPKSDAFHFDHIFNESRSNNEVFEEVVKPIVDASMQGFNGTVFAYGQTSSGKTYTMSGTHKDLGIIPLTINYIFYSIDNTPGREFLLRVSYMEIYNEKVNDLLEIKKKHLKLHEDINGQVVVDVEERVCKNSQEVLEEKYKGDKSRRIGVTNMNERSSRSHTIFRIILESRTTDDEDGAVKVSHLNLVDLAGSERAGQSGATGDRFKEGCHINSSLTTLGLVINQLSEGQEGQFISFRDSKLTRLLQSSLGGNAMTAVICAVTPAAEDQTQNTINFALRAKKIKNTPILNEVLSDAALIKRYLRQIAKLSQELEDTKQKNNTVDQQIECKLKEKEEVIERLNTRIDRLKEVLIVSSSSPVKKKRMLSRSRRRMTWGGQCDRRSFFPSNSPNLGTIAEDISVPSTPQANSTRLDEIICPFEKFELELMKDKSSFWSPEDQDDFDDDAGENYTSVSNITKFPDASMNLDSELDATMTGQSVGGMFKEPETPPSVLRERINSMSNTLTNVIKDYDELREFTTLEKQILGSDSCADHMKQLTVMTQQNYTLISALEEKTAAYDKLEKQYNELNLSYIELEKRQSNKDVNFIEEELQELKEHNLFLQNEVKIKSESYDELLKKFDDINKQVLILSQEKSQIHDECEKLQKKIVGMEKKNLDLEVTLDVKKKKSIERESELERELQTAWEALDKRGQLITKIVHGLPSSSERLQDEGVESVVKDSTDESSNETVTEDQDKTDYLSNQTTFESVQDSDADIRFVSCNMTLTADQSITNTIPVDPLQSFCLSESLIPINIPCTPAKALNTEESHSAIKAETVEMNNQAIIELKNENNILKQQLDEIRMRCDNIITEHDQQVLETRSYINDCNNLLSDLYNIIDINQETDENNRQLKETIKNLKNVERDLCSLKAEKDELSLLLEEYKNYFEAFNALKEPFGFNNEDKIVASMIEEKLLSLKNEVSVLVKELNEKETQFEQMMKCNEAEIKELKNNVHENQKHFTTIEELCLVINEYFNVNITVVEIKDFIQKVLFENSNFKVSLANLESELEKDRDSEREIEELRSMLQESNNLLNELGELLKKEVGDNVKNNNICNIIKDIIQRGKECENEIVKLNSELEDTKSSKQLLQNILETLQSHVDNIDVDNMNEAVQSLLRTDIELANVQKKLEESKEDDIIMNKLCVLLEGYTKKEIFKTDLIDTIKTLLLNIDDLKEDALSARAVCSETQKEYLSKVEDMKKELDETDDLLKRMCSALNDKLSTNVDKKDLLDTVLTLVQYKDKYHRMSISFEENKEFSDIVNNLLNILREDLDEDTSKDKLEDVVVTLKKNNIELKKQLQDGQKITIETESELKNEISSITAKLEATKLYETIVNDVCSVLSETDCEDNNDGGMNIDKVKSAVLSLKESNEELKKRLDTLQNINIESETHYKSEIEILKSELQTGKVYESVMNDLLCVLQDESGNSSGDIDVKNAVLTLKENNSALRKTLTELEIENSLKVSEHLSEIENLRTDVEKNKIYKNIVSEVCDLLQEDSTNIITEDNIVNMVSVLKSNNKELQKLLEARQNANNEIVQTEIDILKTEVEIGKEFKEIVDDLCNILQENTEQIVSKDNVKNLVSSLKESSVKLRDQFTEAQNEFNEKESVYVKEIKELKNEIEVLKSYEKSVNDICTVLQTSDNIVNQSDMKEAVTAIKENNCELKQSLESIQLAVEETRKLHEHEIEILKAELEAGKVYETIMIDLLSVLQEGSEHKIAQDNVKCALIDLKESNLELKNLLEQAQDSVKAVESDYLNKIELLKAELESSKIYERIVHELCCILQGEDDTEVLNENVVNIVKFLKESNKSLVNQLEEDETAKGNNYISEIESLKNEVGDLNVNKIILEQICALFQEDSEKYCSKDEVKDLILAMRNDLERVKSELVTLQNEKEEKERKFSLEIEALKTDLDERELCETIVDDLCSVLQEESDLIITRNVVNSVIINLKESVKELEKQLEEAKTVATERKTVIDLLETKLKSFETRVTLFEDIRCLFVDETNKDLPDELVKNSICELKHLVNELQEKNNSIVQALNEKESMHNNELKEKIEKLEGSQENEKIVKDLCYALRDESDQTVNKDELKNIVTSLKNDLNLLKDRYDTDLKDWNMKLEKGQEYENIINDLVCLLQNDTMPITTNIELKSIICGLKEENISLKNQFNIKLEESQEYENFINDLCHTLRNENETVVTKNELKHFVLNLKDEIALLKNQHHIEMQNINIQLEKSREYENVVNDLCHALRNEASEVIVKDDLVILIKNLKEEFVSLKNKYDIEFEELNHKLEEGQKYENLVNDLCSALQDETEQTISKNELKNIVTCLKDKAILLKYHIEEIHNKYKEMELQFVSEINSLKEELVKMKVLESSNEALMKELETKQILYEKTKEEYEIQLKSFENQFGHCKEYENIVTEIREIFDDYEIDETVSKKSLTSNSDVSINSVFTSIKNSVIALKEENSLLSAELYEIKAQKKLEIDSLKEKLDSYVECVDICYELCCILNDGNDKKITKDEIRDVVLSMKKSNNELAEELNIIKTSYSDINSFTKGEIERLENKLKIASEYESIVNKICSFHFKINSKEISKDEVIVFVQQLNDNYKQSLIEICEKNETIDELNSEILTLKYGIEACEKYENIVTEICKLFADSSSKIAKDEVVNYVLQLKNNCSNIQTQLNELKDELNDVKSKSKVELEELRTILDSQVKYGNIVEEIIKLDISSSADGISIVESIKSLRDHCKSLEKELDLLKSVNNELNLVKEEYDQICSELKDILKLNCTTRATECFKSFRDHFNELEKEIDEIKSLNDKLSAEKEDYDQIFDELKSLLKLDSDFKECEINEVVKNIKNASDDLQNKLADELKVKDELIRLSAENENLSKNLDDYNSCLDLINSLSSILSQDDKISRSDIIDAVISLKKSNSTLNEKLIDVEAKNEEIISKLNVACTDLKAKMEMLQHNERILSNLNDFFSKNFRNNIENTEILEIVKSLKAEHSDMNEKIAVLTSENENIKILQSENNEMERKLQTFKLNEDMIHKLLKDLHVHCSDESNFTNLIESLKQYYVNLEKKFKNDIADRETILGTLREEIDNLKLKMKEVVSESQKNNLDEVKKTNVDTKIEELEDSMKNLKKVNNQLQKWQDNDDNIRKKLINEIKNLKPTFDAKGSKDTSSVQLLEDFISYVMEKETEVVTHLHKNFQAENHKLQDKVNQLKGEKDKLKQWNQQLEDDVISNLNRELSTKSDEIVTLSNKCKRLQDEMKQKSDDMNNVKQKLLEAEGDAVNLRLEMDELLIKVNKEEKVDALKSLCDEMKKDLQSKEEHITILNKNLKEKESEISRLQDCIDSKDSNHKNISDNLKVLKSQISEQTLVISELEKCKDMYTNEISDLKTKLNEKSLECSDLKGSLTVLKEDYMSAKQSLESNVAGTSLLQSQLTEVTKDLEFTKTSLHNLKESMKVEKMNAEKERTSLLTTIEDINKVCKRMELELSRLRKENEDAEVYKKKIKNLEEEIANKNKEIVSKDKELKEEKQAMNLKIKELQEVQELLKVKEKSCVDFEKNISSLANEIISHRDTIIKLKMDLQTKEDQLVKLEKQSQEKLKYYENIENDLKLEKQHLKKLRIKIESLQRKLDAADQKENMPSRKSFSPSNNGQQFLSDSSIYAEKLKLFEKELFSVFDTPPKSLENALQIVKSTVEKVKELEAKLTDVEMEKNDLDKECEDMNEHIQQLNKEITEHYLVKLEKLSKDVDELKTELLALKEINENLKNCNEQLNKDISWLRTENDRLKQSIKELRSEKKHSSTATSEKQLPDGGNKGLLSTPSEFKSLKNKWEQITKATPNKESDDFCKKCDELNKTVQQFKLDLADKNSKISMLEIQIQGENFPYKRKAMLLEESLNEAKTKIMALKQEVRRLQSCLHEVTVFNDCESGGKPAKRKSCSDIAVQASASFDAEQDDEVASSGIVQKQSVNLLREKISKMERESVLLKRLCRDRNKRIETLEQELKRLGISGKV